MEGKTEHACGVVKEQMSSRYVVSKGVMKEDFPTDFTVFVFENDHNEETVTCTISKHLFQGKSYQVFQL